LVVGSVTGGPQRNAARVAWLSGSGWSVRSPVLGRGWVSSSLSAVACASVRFCVAVGQYTTRRAGPLLFAERWDGTRWRQMPIRTPTSVPDETLTGLACASAALCTA